MTLEEATIKILQEAEEVKNKLIYKIILKNGKELDEEFNDLKTAQEEAERLDAQNVKSQYKDNSIKELFKVFIQNRGFIKKDWLKYENNKFYIRDNFGWQEENNQDLYYKMSVKLFPYLLGRYVDPYSVNEYGDTFLIVDTEDGSVYEYDDIGNYHTISELKQELKTVIERTYGEDIYLPYFWDPLDY